MIGSQPDGTSRASYRRSTGTPRGEARRRDLLARVTDDLVRNGLAGFTLRRAARAAGTTHKVLLYHFDGADDLLGQAVRELRARRIDKSLLAARTDGGSLADGVRALWPVLVGAEARALDQAMGLAMYDPARHRDLAWDATDQYLPALRALCPGTWDDRRTDEVGRMVLATLRGLLIARASGQDQAGLESAFRALERALRHEESATP